MIEQDLINFLEADATLTTLLGASAGESKIYPDLPAYEPADPYLVYGWHANDTPEEHVKEDRIQLTVTSALRATCESIRDRLITLLDKQDQVQHTTFTSSTYHIYWCKLTGADSTYDPGRGLYQFVMFFTVKFQQR